jgi:hypothetical protein
MKLEPKAKPIRIRIKIGNEEYSTFDSLRENLNLPELYPRLIDGVFIKWLRQIGEHQRAERAEKIRAMCLGTKDETRNYILLLSLFDKDAEQILSKNNDSIDAFLAKIPIEKLLFLQSKHGFPINRPNVIRPRLNSMKLKDRIEQVKEFFKLDEKSPSFDAEEWGSLMAQIVDEAGEGKEKAVCKDLFDYLIAYSTEQSEALKRIQPVMKTFYGKIKNNYHLTNILTNEELSIEHLSTLYSHDILKGLAINWYELFYACVKNVSQSGRSEDVSATIEEFRKLIDDDMSLWKLFIKLCIKNGIKEADAFNDIEWMELVKSEEDYKIVNKALYNFRIFPFSSFYKHSLDYNKVKAGLGIQIIKLLVFLAELDKDENAIRPNLSDNYLRNLLKIMCEVRKNQYNNYYDRFFKATYTDFLNSMKDFSNLASFMLNHTDLGYRRACNKLSDELRSKLEEEKKRQLR